VTNELYDAYNAEGVADIMNVTLVPFGNAQINTVTKTVSCQHGEEECEGNLWEMCAISHYPDFDVHFPFYYCLENKGERMLNFVESCANSTGLDYDVLSACFNDPDEAWALEQQFAAMTPSYHEYTPWVEVPTGEELSYQNLFLRTVCNDYTGTLPPGCPQAQENEEEHVRKEPIEKCLKN
jgi:interferon gamma-inducible protein 30